jgi:hypothetical protein
MDTHPPPGVDLRESLVNDRRVGTAGQVQLPREAATRLHGLAVDLDADRLKPNVWFPPAASAEDFFKAIRPTLERHPVLRHAEARDSGRWTHLIVRFERPVELMSARDQKHWTAIHRVLISSIPADPNTPALIALTRPPGSVNGKNGRVVRVLKEAAPVSAPLLEGWAEEVSRKPFRTLASVFFGSQRLAPCPYCQAEGSHLDLGDVVAFCYGGPCRHVPLARLHEPFLKAPGGAGKEAGGGVGGAAGGELLAGGPRDAPAGAGEATPVTKVTEDLVLQIDPRHVGSLTIRLAAGPKGGKGS